MTELNMLPSIFSSYAHADSEFVLRLTTDLEAQGIHIWIDMTSIYSQSDPLNLDPFQRNQAKTKRDEANESVEECIPDTYIWLLVPDQPDLRQPGHLQELRLQQPQGSLAASASHRLKMEDTLITQYAGKLLRSEMDRVPLWRGNHVSIKELADFFVSYVYLPRLKNTDVLLEAIRDGVANMLWQQETFAYAESWDAEHNRYLGLKAGQQVQVTLNATSVLVKPEVAAAQFIADETAAAQVQTTTTYWDDTAKTGSAVNERGGTSILEPTSTILTPLPPSISDVPGYAAPPIEGEQQYHRFYGSVKINPRMMAGDAGKIMDEVVKHLTTLYGADIQVMLEIEAKMPKGVRESTRTIEENCRTLRFEGFGFEKE